MRYAAPPTGTLRWQAPRTPATVAGIQQANAQPNTCLQASSGSSPTTPFHRSSLKRAAAAASEDCLFLNVYTPGVLSDRTNKLPVVVWIHGGGYVGGSAGSFNGDDLIRESNNGVVVVIIQYRLGVFGFLPGAAVKNNGALNTGLLDQEFSLKWVQTHIGKFGGDPTQVTIWGESAGAGSVFQHVIANDGKTTPPLFRGAITSSTFLPSQYNFNDPAPEQLYSETLAQTNCSTAANSLACLRNVPVATLQNANTRIASSSFFGTFIWAPVVDGTFITQRPTVALRQGKVNGKAVLAVTNTFEGAAFVNANTASTVQVPDYIGNLFPNFNSTETAAGAAIYRTVGTPLAQAIGIMGESIFICPTYYLLRAFSGTSFKGEFAIPPGGHGQDVAYYFTSQNANGVPQFNNTAFDKAFAQSFLNFALSLDPNIKSDPSNITPRWNTWATGNTEMLFNKTDAGLPVVTPTATSGQLLDRCDFWEALGSLSGQ
ncbi:Alpha/Beta hydrolase protein [Collybia nuda]|uniref:Carboxylic ester hydrolase n=1 Tax=Collybia nuda TaxID=64659 RepID=A0A9P6CPN8_9AGAR|nr:Alpha/Beta hydrolase protein [Collybia nuda]